MDSNVTALQNLYVALGGQLTDTYEGIANGAAVSNYTVIPDVINAIAQRAGGAGIELPVVGKSDNGSVLTVVNGAWAKAAIPSQLPSVAATDAGQVLTVSDEGTWVADDIPSQLPAVTADDNGDVLKVVDGAWAKGTDLTE